MRIFLKHQIPSVFYTRLNLTLSKKSEKRISQMIRKRISNMHLYGLTNRWAEPNLSHHVTRVTKKAKTNEIDTTAKKN